MMSVGKKLGSIVVVGAVVLSACGGDAEESPAEQSTTQADATPTSTTAPITTTDNSNLDIGEVPMNEALDPAGSTVGGNVGRSYAATTYPTELTGIVGLAISDLAGRLAIDESAITVVLVEEVVWNDGSHGCPQPGMSYTQALTDGLRIVLETEGLLYDYRSGGSSNPALCVQAEDKDETRAGMFELTPEGEVIPVTIPDKETGTPTEGLNPPDE
jgi:hypothetical protein